MAQQDIQISVPIIGVDIAPVAYAEQILDRGTNMTLDEVAKKSVAYGPYASVAAAHTALSADGLNTVGTTVGISGSNNTVVEYWYQGGTAQANLVEKSSGGGGSEQIQSDWNQTDSTKKDFIKNKPNIPDTSDYYTKLQSDSKYQQKGNYQPAGDYATKTELNGKVDKVSGKGLSTNDYTNEDKAKVAAAITEHQDISGKADKSEVVAEKNRAEAAEEQLRAYYEALSQSQPIPKTAEEWAAMTSWQEGVIYRVAGTTSYADWMYNGTATIKMAEYDNAIDDEPTAGSQNLVKSSGVAGSEQVINNRLGDVSTFVFEAAGEKPFYTRQGYTYIVTNTGSAYCVVTLRIERSGTGYNRTELGAGQSAEITAEVDAKWLRCGQATSLTFKLKNNINDNLDSISENLAEQVGKVKRIYSIVDISPTVVTLEANECYLNSTSGNIVQIHENGTADIIAPTDGMMVLYKGMTLRYSSTEESWIPMMPKKNEVICGYGIKFRWRTDNNKILPFLSESASDGWISSIPQKIHIGDSIIVQGVGTESNKLLIITDEQFNVTQTIVSAGGKAPIVFISDLEGYVFHNCTNSSQHYLYISSSVNEFDIIGIFDSNPKTYYNMPVGLMDCYYNTSTGGFVINDGTKSLNITDFIKSVTINGAVITCRGKKYVYDKYGLFDGFKFELGVNNQTPILPATIAQYKTGINFQYTSFCDEIYAKFDGLSTNYSSYITKYDAVTLASSYGHNMSYPEYCNLNGQASGGYLPTPTYRTYLYKIAAPVSTPLNQTNYNSKKRVLLIGGNHPYEIAAPANLYLLVRNLLETMASDADAFSVMANTEFYILPCLNGYGIYHSQDGYMRLNANGVNINRNFPTERWEKGTAGTQNYGGDSAGSEFETKLVMYLTDGIVPHICIDAHNFDKASRQFFGTFGVGKTDTQNHIYKFFLEASRKLKGTYPEYFGSDFGYITEQDSTIAMAGGGSTNDWWSINGGIAESVTFEISRCINYENGVINLNDFIDDYGNTLFSINEFALRLMLYILLNG